MIEMAIGFAVAWRGNRNVRASNFLRGLLLTNAQMSCRDGEKENFVEKGGCIYGKVGEGTS